MNQLGLAPMRMPEIRRSWMEPPPNTLRESKTDEGPASGGHYGLRIGAAAWPPSAP